MPTVRIENAHMSNKWNEWDETRVYVDDELVGQGSYGGEPEDNCLCRDYAWVPSLLTDLATKLGAKVERKEITRNEGEE